MELEWQQFSSLLESTNMVEVQQSRHDLMRQLADIRKQLQHFGIRDASHYAEALVAEVLGSKRHPSGVNKGHDIRTDSHGRVEVKCRQLSSDGRIEERIELRTSKKDGFDYLALVIFHTDFSVKGAVIVPYASVWETVSASKYFRVSYSQACQLTGACDITEAVRNAAER